MAEMAAGPASQVNGVAGHGCGCELIGGHGPAGAGGGHGNTGESSTVGVAGATPGPAPGTEGGVQPGLGGGVDGGIMGTLGLGEAGPTSSSPHVSAIANVPVVGPVRSVPVSPEMSIDPTPIETGVITATGSATPADVEDLRIATWSRTG